MLGGARISQDYEFSLETVDPDSFKMCLYLGSGRNLLAPKKEQLKAVWILCLNAHDLSYDYFKGNSIIV